MNTMTTSSGYVYREINVIYNLQRKINYQTVKPGLSAMKYRINLSFFLLERCCQGNKFLFEMMFYLFTRTRNRPLFCGPARPKVARLLFRPARPDSTLVQSDPARPDEFSRPTRPSPMNLLGPAGPARARRIFPLQRIFFQ